MHDGDPSRPWVRDLLSSPSGAVTQMRYLAIKRASAPQDQYYLETSTFNVLNQLTRLTTVAASTATVMDMEYRFSGTQNNGKITSQKDYVSGEEVTYQYDSLQRLISAVTTDPSWGLSFNYDGFGNRLDSIVTKGAGPAMSLLIDKTNNRIMSPGFSYDANGNMTASPLLNGVTYDVDNRLKAANGDQYGYDASNKRIWKKKPDGSEEFYFFGAMGREDRDVSADDGWDDSVSDLPQHEFVFCG
jgi:hypothetical protein